MSCTALKEWVLPVVALLVTEGVDSPQKNVKNNKYKYVYGIVHKAFVPAIVGISGQIHADFLRLL